ncbi:MAG: hypothetical protein AB7P14_19200 [Blastocatellales bacterium]
MKQTIAIDSNALTYLIEAIDPDYDPSTDKSDVVLERIAMIRSYLYCDCFFRVLPTVSYEYSRISKEEWRLTHERVSNVLFLDDSSELDEDMIRNRAKDFFIHHPKKSDCRVAAEAEAAGVTFLLTLDKDLIDRLGTIVKGLSIMKPTDFLAKLGIGPATKPIRLPTPSNPLYSKNWWRLD